VVGRVRRLAWSHPRALRAQGPCFPARAATPGCARRCRARRPGP
jgi:hypothetical protein